MINQPRNNVILMFKDIHAVLPEQQVPSETLQAALDIVAHAHDSGLVMVPNTATPEMIEAAQAIISVPENDVQKMWQAMLQAW